MRTPRPLPLLLAALALAAPAAGGQTKKERAELERAGDPEDREGDPDQGVGTIPLGATAVGVIVQGFYNTISFEAVRGTVVTVHLRTRHRTATPLGELLDPRRQALLGLEPVDGDPKHLALVDYELPETGEFTVRFGFRDEENGDYVLTTTATYPTGFTRSVTVPAGGEATLPIDGMLGRKLKRVDFLLPEGAEVGFRLLDDYDDEIDVARQTRRMTFGRRVVVKNVPIDSLAPLRLTLSNSGDDDATFDVVVEYENPKLSRRKIKI